jgi:multiple sugar transport system ATP-binding protein
MAGVTFDEVCKQFPGAESFAVDHLRLDVEDGEFLVVVGPSGCGKTTALRMLAGLETVTSGEITIGGRAVTRVSPQDRDVAMVFQSYALYPHKTVYGNMAFGMRMRGMPKSEIETRVTEVAAMLGLDELLARKPRELSGGQRQRVALGRAIVRRPQVFLLDEPLSNLDAALRLETRINLRELQDRIQTTFIYVTHDQVEAMTLGDRIAVMKDGVLQQIAPPEEIYGRPANVFVAGFVGSPKMNFLPVTLRGGVAETDGVRVPIARAADVDRALLGIRPEAFAVVGAEHHPRVVLKVRAREMLGAEQILYGKIGSNEIAARVDPHLPVTVGDDLTLSLKSEHLHVFDAQSELALENTAERVG